MIEALEKWHTIKPGTPEYGSTEHGTPAEGRNNPEHGYREQRNAEHQRNNRNTTEQRRNTGITEHHRS